MTMEENECPLDPCISYAVICVPRHLAAIRFVAFPNQCLSYLNWSVVGIDWEYTRKEIVVISQLSSL